MGPKILTIDDSRTIRLCVADAFKPFACEILEAADGAEGLAMIRRERPDLIILDYAMPVMDGCTLLSNLQADPALRHIPAIMLTAETGREAVSRTAHLGVRDYLIKPFKQELLLERVERIIELKARSAPAEIPKRFDDPLRLLVVDDGLAIADQVRDSLAETPWSVCNVANTSEAMDYCASQVPDVVLVSLSLPEGAGFILLQMIRAGARSKRIPLFAVDSTNAPTERQRAWQMAVTGIISQPIDPDELKLKITRALS